MIEIGSAVLDAFAKQIGWCESLGSPFTAQLLTVLRDDVAADGTSAELARAWPGDPVADALALRMASGAARARTGGVRRPTSPPAIPRAPRAIEQLRSVVLDAVREHQSAVGAFLISPPQTNEVGRSGVLVGGFLQIAKDTGLPLRLLEIGASAGLNTIWDRSGSLPRHRGLGRPTEARQNRAELGRTLAASSTPLSA